MMSAPLHLTRRRCLCVLGALGALGLLLMLAALCVGTVALGPGDVLAWFSAASHASLSATVLDLRLQRIGVAFVSGATLALAGTLMQTLLRNPLADPYVLGLSGGAATGALLAMLLAAPLWMIEAGAGGGALVAMVLVAALAQRDLRSGGDRPQATTRLLLTGVMLAAAWGAGVTLLLALAPDGTLRGMVFWLMGDLGGAQWRTWPAVLLLVLLVVSMRLARPLNVMTLGAQMAWNLGLNVQRLRLLLLAAASLLAASAVSSVGSIGFVGLVVPHACRRFFTPDHRLLLPASALSGGLFLLLADTLARTVLAPQQLPVGVITALIGVPVFLWQLAHEPR